jgi:hypothetical protein
VITEFPDLAAAAADGDLEAWATLAGVIAAVVFLGRAALKHRKYKKARAANDRLRKRSPLSSRGTVRTGPGKSPKRRTGVPDGSERWSSKPGKETSAENARGHFEKHAVKKNEFPELKTEKQYVDAANDFVTDPPKTAEIFARESGEVMIYDPPSNTFAVRTPEGPPATYMRPKNGVKYWETQLEIDGGKRQ